MKIINFAEHPSLVSTFMRELRDVDIQKDMMRFRRNIERIGEVAAYEISKELYYEETETRTCLGVAKTQILSDRIVVGSILRAGLPLHQGLANAFDGAGNAFVSAYREYDNETDFHVKVEYLASPRIEGKVLILADPMLATGASMELAYHALLGKGTPKELHLVSVIASRQAIEYVRTHFPADTTLWVAAIDDTLNEHKYIVPGLGDAGDLAFGTKDD